MAALSLPFSHSFSHSEFSPATASSRQFTRMDACVIAADSALRTVSGVAAGGPARPPSPATAPPGRQAPRPLRPDEAAAVPPAPLDDAQRRLSGALMRVNHVGEVCAQALYQAQALTARSETLRAQMRAAAQEETDHLAWTQARLQALGARPSLLNPLWYAGAFAIGLAAGRLGDRISLGFVVETERQVEAHLASHLDRLPPEDLESRAIVAQMKADEARHADEALAAGATPVPPPVQWLMRAAARVMTTVAHRV